MVLLQSIWQKSVKKIIFFFLKKKQIIISAKNPYAQLKDVYSLEQIKSSPQVFGPLTKLQCCPTSDGSAAAIIASEKFVIENNLQNQAIEIVAQVMATDSPSLLEKRSSIELAGVDMTRKAAKQVYEMA